MARLITRTNVESSRPWSERVPYSPLAMGL